MKPSVDMLKLLLYAVLEFIQWTSGPVYIQSGPVYKLN